MLTTPYQLKDKAFTLDNEVENVKLAYNLPAS